MEFLFKTSTHSITKFSIEFDIKCQNVDCIALNTPQKLFHLLFTKNIFHYIISRNGIKLFCQLHYKSNLFVSQNGLYFI